MIDSKRMPLNRPNAPPYTETYVDEGRLDDIPPTPTSPTLPQHQQHYDRPDDNFSMDHYGQTLAPSMQPHRPPMPLHPLIKFPAPDSTSPRVRPAKQSSKPTWHRVKLTRDEVDPHYESSEKRRTEKDADPDIAYMLEDLSQKKINNIHKHLWWVGRQGNIRPLHHQKAMFREIVITERCHLHMVWFENVIFLKPLPEYLLDRAWFENKICPKSELYELACGFLYSYSRLIVHRSDHHIAIEEGLLPDYMDWVRWCRFSKEIREGVDFCMVNKRYRYGELRLKRLNHVYRFCKFQVRGFYSLDRGYNSFFRRNFGWMVGLFAFLTIILTGMQVVLATGQGQAAGHGLFEEVSYVFGVVSIIIPVVGTGTALALFFVLFWWNFVKTLLHRKKIQNKRREKEDKLVKTYPPRGDNAC